MNKIIVERSTVDIFDRATVSVFFFAELKFFVGKKKRKKGWGKYQNRDLRDTFIIRRLRRHVSRMDETVKNCDNLPCFLK